MTYSCTDFYDDVMRCMVDAGVVDDLKRADGADAVGVDADLAIEAVATVKRMLDASHFFDELLSSVETLPDIAERYGAGALASLMHLQFAISRAACIAVSPGESAFLDLVRAMPSADEWLRHVECEVGSERVDDCNVYPESVLDLIREADLPANGGAGYLLCVTTKSGEFFRGAVRSSAGEIERTGAMELDLWEPRGGGKGATGLELRIPVDRIAQVRIEW